jgi:hypothetical protein
VVKIKNGKKYTATLRFFLVVDENNFDENGVQYNKYAMYDEEESSGVDRTQNILAATAIGTKEMAEEIARYYNEDYSKTGAIVLYVEERITTTYTRINND